MRALRPVCFLALLVGLVAGSAWAGPLEDARQQAREGDLSAAIESARKALEADPGDIRTARLLQDLLLRAGRDAEAEKLATEGVENPDLAAYLAARIREPEAAVKALKKLKGADTDFPTFRLDLGWAFLGEGSLRSAESEAKAYAKDQPEDPEGHYLLGMVHQKGRDAKDARKAFESVLQLEPAQPRASVALAEVLHDLEEPEEARAVLRRALDTYSANPALRLGLAQDQVRVGELDAAEKTLTALTQERGIVRADAYAWLARVHRLRGEIDEAFAATNKALEIDGKNLVALDTKGFCLLKQKKFQDALDTYAYALEFDRERIETYVGIAYAQTQLGEIKFAEEMLEKALKLDKKHIDANLKMAIVQYLKGKNRTAKKHLKVVEKQDDKNLAMLRYYGYVALAEGKAKDALDWLGKALEIESEDAKTVRMIGRAYLELGKQDEALTMFERAVSIDAKNHWAHFDLGKCHDRMGEIELAKASYEDAIELAPEFAWPHLYLGDLYDQVDGDAEMAVEHYRKFLELGGPDPDEKVQKRIEQLTKD